MILKELGGPQQLSSFRHPEELHMRRMHLQELSRAQFVELFERPRMPTVITGLIEDWPAQERWTEQALLQRFGDHRFKVRILPAWLGHISPDPKGYAWHPRQPGSMQIAYGLDFQAARRKVLHMPGPCWLAPAKVKQSHPARLKRMNDCRP